MEVIAQAGERVLVYLHGTASGFRVVREGFRGAAPGLPLPRLHALEG